MNKYFLRTIPADYEQMIALGVTLGAIKITDEVISAPGGCWDYIGPIYVPTGEVVQNLLQGPVPVMTPRVDANGAEYIHVNLITPVNLKESAQALAEAHPEVAAGLANLSKYFLVDAEGNAVAPNMPHRVFAT